LTAEVNYLDKIVVPLEKSYHFWHHRKHILTKLVHLLSKGDSPQSCSPTTDLISSEKLFMDKVCEHDLKNYHVWTHRAWFLNLLDGMITVE